MTSSRHSRHRRRSGREIERTRRELGDTVDALSQRRTSRSRRASRRTRSRSGSRRTRCRSSRRSAAGRAGRAGPPDQEAMTRRRRVPRRRRTRHRPRWTRLVGRAQAHGQGVPGGQPHRLGGRADLLLRPGDLPGADRARVDPRARGRVRHAAADRQPRHRGARPRQGDLHQRDQEPPGRPGCGRGAVHRRPARRAVVGLGLRGAPSCGRPTRSTTCPRAGRSGRRCRCASGSR